MAIDILVPTLGESVTEATLAKWFKAVGDTVAVDEPLAELETDKVSLEVNAPAAGVLMEIRVPEGADVGRAPAPRAPVPAAPRPRGLVGLRLRGGLGGEGVPSH